MTCAAPTITTAATADLEGEGLAELRTLLDGAFGERFGADDWSHALGGVHVLARRGDTLLGHAAVVVRQLLLGDHTLRTGYVEAVAVAPDARRQGVAGAVMAEVERLVRGGFELGALAASEDGARLYDSRGWTRWRGPLHSLTPSGVVDGDDAWAYVLGTPQTPVALDPDAPLTCDWRRGDRW